MSKIDRQGVRTPAGLEQKYSFGSVFKHLERENARQNSEAEQQGQTMAQFISSTTSSLDKLAKDITAINKSLTNLSNKDTELGSDLEKFGNALEKYWQTVYPVGSIYVSVSNTSPATLFGGEWVRIKDTFLLASGDDYSAGATGGEAEHTLTVDEMPSHRHGTNNVSWAGSKPSGYGSSGYLWAYDKEGIYPINESYFNTTGGSQPHNNMPPYLAVYVWKRTS